MRFLLVLFISWNAATTLASETFEKVPIQASSPGLVGQIFRRIIPNSIQNYISGYQGEAAGYQIDLEFLGVSDTSLFTSAQAKWQTVIAGDLTEATGICFSDSCGELPCTIDDLRICGQYLSIDGVGGTIGAAGPNLMRTDGSSLPYAGGTR